MRREGYERQSTKKGSGSHNFAILSGREHICRSRGTVRARIPTHGRRARPISKFRTGAGLNVNTGIMLIAVVRPAIGTFVIRRRPRFSRRFLQVHTVYTTAPRVHEGGPERERRI